MPDYLVRREMSYYIIVTADSPAHAETAAEQLMEEKDIDKWQFDGDSLEVEPEPVPPSEET